ncbi:hypothetical protein [Natronobeatus ordinarius]|uniref:hypothetical protein n=1 Tax=Natronobeatus ordinarius TaxID=2963433 RepID=UPI0020CF84DD|nr:hypothetical protein [Natronobeatus ordinarius]
MGVGSNLRKMGAFLEACEGEGGTVHAVEVTEGVDSEPGLTADVELTISMKPAANGVDGVAPATVELDSDGRLQLVLESAVPVVPASDHGLELEPAEATITGDGTITVALDASVPNGSQPTAAEESTARARSSSQRSASSSADDGPAGTRRRNRPPFRDPELLASVYDSCETFAEMAEVIEMDVTAETVRRYMIDHGIHEPNSYDTDSGEDDKSEDDVEPEPDSETVTNAAERPETRSESEREADQPPVVLTDGIGLPDGVSLDVLVESVSRSNTIYEVGQDVGLDREETLELLRRLNLVDLVVGRLAREHERDIGREEIVARLRQVSATQPAP